MKEIPISQGFLYENKYFSFISEIKISLSII